MCKKKGDVMRVCLLHVGGNTAAIHAEDDGVTFLVFVNGKLAKKFSELGSARSFALHILSVMDSGVSDE